MAALDYFLHVEGAMQCNGEATRSGRGMILLPLGCDLFQALPLMSVVIGEGDEMEQI